MSLLERLGGSSDLFLVAPIRDFPCLKCLGLFTALVQLATMMLIFVSFSLDDDAHKLGTDPMKKPDYIGQAPTDVELLPRTPPPPSAPHEHPGPTRTYKTNPAFLLSKEKEKAMRRPAGETPRLCNTPGRGCHRRSCA